MKRAVLLFTLSLFVFGCKQNAQSQQAEEGFPPQRVLPVPEAVGSEILLSRQTAITRAVQVATPAVVSVNVIEVQRVPYRDPFSDPFFERFFGRRRSQIYERQVQGVGSGFVISPDGYIVTNDHVAGKASKITIAFQNGKKMDAELIGSDPATDIALVKVTPDEPLPYLSFSQETPAIVGEWAIALGNPFGLFEAAEPTVTVGVVSATGRDFEPLEGHLYRDMIQTDAAINQGNSGGPLINALSEVIGVNTFIYTQRGSGSIGLGFAVPADKVAGIVEELQTFGTVDRSYYTGLYGMDVSQRIAQALGLDQASGVFVRDIDPGSPADAAGFQPYDVITSLNGEPIANRSDFVAQLYDFRPGDSIVLGVQRDGRQLTLRMQIGSQNG